MKKTLFYIVLIATITWMPLKRMVSADTYGEGENLYEHKCQICHGPRGNGEGPAAAAFSPHPANFTSPAFWQQKDIDQIITRTIKNGHGAMPAFELNAEEIQSIIDYLSQAFKPKR